jgi:hypothetical protein
MSLEDLYLTRELDYGTEWLRILNRELNPKAPMINTDLLVRTYRYIIKHPDEYSQRRWGQRRLFHANRFCFAGHAANLAGARPLLSWQGRFGFPHQVVTPDGRKVNIVDYATEVLGLTDYQSHVLFSEFASTHLIRSSIRQWTGIDPAPRSPGF